MNFRVFQKKQTKKNEISHYYLKKCLLILVTLKFRLAIVQKDRPHEITLSSISKPETDSTVVQPQWSVVIRAVLYFSNNRPCQDTFLAVTNLQWGVQRRKGEPNFEIKIF